MKKIIIGSSESLEVKVNEKIQDFVSERGITIEKVYDPFSKEPFIITDPYRKFREEIQNVK